MTHDLAFRIAELELFAASEGITLPWPAHVIVTMEDAGHIIDLTNGACIEQGAQIQVYPTTVGEAELFVDTILGDIPL
ncbi:MAG: hypothetical protein AB7R40_22440 [Nitrospiraceae bacterium]